MQAGALASGCAARPRQPVHHVHNGRRVNRALLSLLITAAVCALARSNSISACAGGAILPRALRQLHLTHYAGRGAAILSGAHQLLGLQPGERIARQRAWPILGCKHEAVGAV